MKFHPLPRDEARAELGWDQAPFTLLYAGTLGLAHGLEIVLDAAERLRARDDIRFVLSGEGATKTDLMAAADARAAQRDLPARPAARPHAGAALRRRCLSVVAA